MKIRNGFVSNSSSSSFIIQVNCESEKCPTCGHTPQSIVDTLRRINHGGYGEESSVEGIEEYISDNLEYELNTAKTFLDDLKRRDPKSRTYSQSSYYSDVTVAETMTGVGEEIERLEATIADYRQREAAGDKVYRLQLDHHDPLAQHILDENVAAGLVTILEGE